MASLSRNYIFNIMLNVSRVIFPLITAPYISRVLEPEGVGLYNFANSYAAYFSLFALLGIPLYGIRLVARTRHNRAELNTAVSEIFSIATITTLFASALYVASIFLIPKLTENKLLFLIAGLVLYVAPAQIDWYYSGQERFDFIAVRVVSLRILSIIGMFIFVKTRQDLIIYMLLYVGGLVGGNIWNYIMLLRDGIRPHLKFTGLRQHFKPMTLLFASQLAISVYAMLDTVMLGFIADDRQTGFYSNANHIAMALVAVVTSMSYVAIPKMTLMADRGQHSEINIMANKTLGIVMLVAIPISLGLCFIAPDFVPLFYGNEFMGTIIPLTIVSLIVMVIGFSNLVGVQILIGMGHDSLFLKTVLMGAVSNFTANMALIPFLGAIGAAIASLLSETLLLCTAFYLMMRHTPVRFTTAFRDIFKSLCGALLFLPLLIGLRCLFSGWVLIGVYTVTGACVYFLAQRILRNSSLTVLTAKARAKLASMLRRQGPPSPQP